MSAFDFNGRVAIVTGGARGIGRAISELLLAGGARVVVADSGVTIAGDSPDATVAEEFANSSGACAFAQDIAATGAAQAAVKLAIERFGAIDIVVNNAAILKDSFIFKGNAADYEQVLRNNLAAAYAVLAAATPAMREQIKQGRAPGAIVNIVSSAGLYGNFGQSAYASAKAGLTGLTRVVAMDMARSQVNCNAVAPFAATRVTDIIQPANAAQASYKERALRIPARHVAQLVGFLASAKPGSVTGQLFGVRGREVFLFSQPRPVARTVAPEAGWSAEALDRAMQAEFAAKFTDLSTDLEAFNTEPLV